MLEGIKVIEMATYIAAPGAGGILADWGADVIKVEPLTGCPMRGFLGSIGVDGLAGNPVFSLDNRGKKGVALDTSTPEGVEAIKRMVKDADVFLTNVRPGGLERSGLDYESLKAVNPKLVYATVSGYGLEGPDKDRPGFDAAAFYARSGFAQIMTPKGQEPAPIRMAVGDHITSLATVSGILAALLESQRTGKGKLVESSLLRTGIYAGSCDMSIQLMYGKLSSTKSRYEALNPISNFFQAADGKWFIIVPRQGSKDWPALAKVIDDPAMLEDERFETPKLRRKHARELVEHLDAAFAAHEMDYWAERLDAQDIVWAPLAAPREVVDDPQAIAAGAFTEIEGPGGEGTFRSPAAPIRFDHQAEGPHPAAPDLGEHTDEVLRRFGYSDEDLAALRASKTIA